MNNPPAFPNVAVKDPFDRSGMSLRDYMAAKAMQGIISYATHKGIYPPPNDELANAAYELADAMLAAREKQ